LQGKRWYSRRATVLTPHAGEFKRLFPHIELDDRIGATQRAAEESGAIVLLKGARTIIAAPDGTVWLLPESTPALARRGSGDVLTGLMAGLLSQIPFQPIENGAAMAAYWHAQAGILAASERTQMGVDGVTLAQYLTRIPGSF
jgi:NAD(P)H-hydrate epimerase